MLINTVLFVFTNILSLHCSPWFLSFAYGNIVNYKQSAGDAHSFDLAAGKGPVVDLGKTARRRTILQAGDGYTFALDDRQRRLRSLFESFGDIKAVLIKDFGSPPLNL